MSCDGDACHIKQELNQAVSHFEVQMSVAICECHILTIIMSNLLSVLCLLFSRARLFELKEPGALTSNAGRILNPVECLSVVACGVNKVDMNEMNLDSTDLTRFN